VRPDGVCKTLAVVQDVAEVDVQDPVTRQAHVSHGLEVVGLQVVGAALAGLVERVQKMQELLPGLVGQEHALGAR
jgi:hypothetical protein